MSNLILKVFLFAGLDEVSTKIKGLSSFTDIRCRVGELMTGKRGYKQTFFWFVCRWIYKRGTSIRRVNSRDKLRNRVVCQVKNPGKLNKK